MALSVRYLTQMGEGMVESAGFKTETPVPRTTLGVVRSTCFWLAVSRGGLSVEAGLDFDLLDVDGLSRLAQLES